MEEGGTAKEDVVEDDPLLGYNFERCLRVTPDESLAVAPEETRDYTRLAYGGVREHVRLVYGKSLASVRGMFRGTS